MHGWLAIRVGAGQWNRTGRSSVSLEGEGCDDEGSIINLGQGAGNADKDFHFIASESVAGERAGGFVAANR